MITHMRYVATLLYNCGNQVLRFRSSVFSASSESIRSTSASNGELATAADAGFTAGAPTTASAGISMTFSVVAAITLAAAVERWVRGILSGCGCIARHETLELGQ